jgi:hypothetical protein
MTKRQAIISKTMENQKTFQLTTQYNVTCIIKENSWKCVSDTSQNTKIKISN